MKCRRDETSWRPDLKDFLSFCSKCGFFFYNADYILLILSEKVFCGMVTKYFHTYILQMIFAKYNAWIYDVS